MRCICCDVELSSYEATRRARSDGSFLDMCNTCYSSISEDVPSIVRKDLANKHGMENLSNGNHGQSDDDTLFED